MKVTYTGKVDGNIHTSVLYGTLHMNSFTHMSDENFKIKILRKERANKEINEYDFGTNQIVLT